MSDLFTKTAHYACEYLDSLDDRYVFPPPTALAALARFEEPFPTEPTDPAAVIDLLHALGTPAAVANAGGRYYGFVNGGTLPVTVAANWLATAWDQNGGPGACSPIGVQLETIALGWLLDALGLPGTTGGGFVTGATMASFTGLAAARHVLLQQVGWDVEAQGLFGAPPISVIVGDEVHVSLLKALSLVGLGRDRVVRVPVDGQGRMQAGSLPTISGPTIVCLQAGNVNTGAFDPADAIIPVAHDAGAWVHVDGAFGLWAAAAPNRAHLMNGYNAADSWATDAHKWLNVPYDSGLVFCRDAAHLHAAMSATAAYLVPGGQREPMHYTPEMSRRARGIDIWAALKSLGRSGLADMIERNCQQATLFAAGLRSAGYSILNEVVLNQVLVSFGDAAKTQRVIQALQADGTLWCGGTVWQGHTAMRISVSSWATTGDDVERCLDTIIRIAADA